MVPSVPLFGGDPHKMLAAANAALAAARELDEAAAKFSSAKVGGQAPVVRAANRRTARHAKILSGRADDLRRAAASHKSLALDAIDAQKKGKR